MHPKTYHVVSNAGLHAKCTINTVLKVAAVLSSHADKTMPARGPLSKVKLLKQNVRLQSDDMWDVSYCYALKHSANDNHGNGL